MGKQKLIKMIEESLEGVGRDMDVATSLEDNAYYNGLFDAYTQSLLCIKEELQ